MNDAEVVDTKVSLFKHRQIGRYRLEARELHKGIWFWQVTKDGLMVAGSGYDQGDYGTSHEDACVKAKKACIADATLYRIPIVVD